jgi:hypothetical protein
MSAEQNAVLIMNRQPQPILEKYSRDQVRQLTSFCTTTTRHTDTFLVSGKRGPLTLFTKMPTDSNDSRFQNRLIGQSAP